MLVTSIDLMATDARFLFYPFIAEWLKLYIDNKVWDKYGKEAVYVVCLFVNNRDRIEMPIHNKEKILSHLDTIIVEDKLLYTNRYQVSKTL